MKKKRRWSRRLLLGAAFLGVGMALVYVVMLGLMRRWVAEPPELAALPAITETTPLNRGDRVYVGDSWFGTRDGMPVLYLTGTPFELGYANGVLTKDLIHRQEEAVLELLDHLAPQAWLRFLLEFVVVYKNRNLPAAIAPDLQMEIYGISHGCPDIHPEVGPHYHRILNYHGAQDISYMLMHSPLIQGGCTAFGAWDSFTADGHLITGRNFDWEADPVFDEGRLVILCEPENGIPFVSLAWAGMAGVVSGMNREGVSITVNGAPSELPQDAATPTCLVARAVLQEAHNLDEAVAIIRRHDVFVSALFLVGSVRDGRFIVVEKTAETTVVREPDEGQSHIICANHYLTTPLRDASINQAFLRTDTSLPRFERARELLEKNQGGLDAGTTAAILRDRLLPGDVAMGDGHRSALNPLIATHAVIMDLSSGIFWAAAPPHQLGHFVAFDVADFEKEHPELRIGEDPWKTEGGYDQYLQAQVQLTEGWASLKSGDWKGAVDAATEAERLNPGYYANAWLRAEGLRGQGKRDEALESARAALEGQPALARERKRIESLIAEAGESE